MLIIVYVLKIFHWAHVYILMRGSIIDKISCILSETVKGLYNVLNCVLVSYYLNEEDDEDDDDIMENENPVLF